MLGSRIMLTEALNLMDEKFREGMPQGFSIKWVAKSGEIMELDNAQKCGLKASIDRKRYIGVKAINNNHHPHNVEIHTILAFNGKRVYF